MKIVEACLGVRSCRANLCDRKECPLRIVQRHQVSSGRAGFGHQSASYRPKLAGSSSCRPASGEFLCAHAESGQKYSRQKGNLSHYVPAVSHNSELVSSYSRKARLCLTQVIVTLKGND